MYKYMHLSRLPIDVLSLIMSFLDASTTESLIRANIFSNTYIVDLLIPGNRYSDITFCNVKNVNEGLCIVFG